MTDLERFVRERLDEAEREAQKIPSGNPVDYLALDLKCHSGKRTPGDTPDGANILWAAQHVADYVPEWTALDGFRERTMADIAFKRQLLELYDIASKDGFGGSEGWVLIRDAIYALAALWSDHEDYDPTWRTQ